ncbi:hypothetical protein VC83_08133 [Pseudogymnoascus destructans]|uniref:P-loop containing nucleoside triphosphate hydrolase protein n=2 Tax=Pseudogymnoascus destructans TaxID=655981 RepID=L8FYX1_PSED2|nr:uncharacterized protein VC83_08133 [Pseudogymnoascus destructans]ELR06052.1 hypothetical protein GMDG_07763 [Pseudogymnoascus destructans 20631-21]OAF55252.1 hypothetical protein VC83_08133 [Pseudogymnoascus destructans]
MSNKPIFVATHPRACSTAFERVFMTRKDLQCIHEPFGDAFYFGPERLSSRYEADVKARDDSGFSDSTFASVFEQIEKKTEEGKRVFIKDITHYLAPPHRNPASIAPSLGGAPKRGVGTNGAATNGVTNGVATTNGNGTNGHTTSGHVTNGNVTNGNTTSSAPYPYNTEAEPGNPTMVPEEILKKFHFTFLIRHPRSSIPSYYRCTIPPLNKVTGFYNFDPSEAGYDELRRVFDFLKSKGHVGPAIAGEHDGELQNGEVSITMIDADDLLDNPNGIIEAYCKEVGIDYDPGMLNWDTEEDHAQAKRAFEKWRGFHNDAIESSSLKPRKSKHAKKTKTVEEENECWKETYGAEGAKIIRDCVDANIPDYEYLKSFALKVPFKSPGEA